VAAVKTSTLTIRIEPTLKEAIRSAAHQQHRSIANMVEVMIRDHCVRAGIPLVPDPPPAESPTHKASRRDRSRLTTQPAKPAKKHSPATIARRT